MRKKKIDRIDTGTTISKSNPWTEPGWLLDRRLDSMEEFEAYLASDLHPDEDLDVIREDYTTSITSDGKVQVFVRDMMA